MDPIAILQMGPSQTGPVRLVQPCDVLLLLLGSQSRQGVRQIPAVPLQTAALPGPGFLHAQLVLGTLKLQLQIQHLSFRHSRGLQSATDNINY